jgi:uncharacterized protein YbjT (DUF2867 family)
MNQKKSILVIGATGAQGSSVAAALLADQKFTVKAFTRNPESENALRLKEAGAEIIKGNLDDMESLKMAMKGCYGVFGVTNFWEHFGKEYQQGKNLIDAVKEMQIKHFVFHTLPSYSKLSNGNYPTPHCDIKAELEEYAKSERLQATFVHVAFYYENFFTFFPPQKGEDNVYSFGFPQGDTKLAMVSIEDLGGVVATIFNNPQVYTRKTIGVVGQDNTCTEYAAVMSKVLSENIRYNYIPRDVFAKFPFPGAEELANMFEVQRLYIPNRQIDLIDSYEMNPQMQSFESWLIKNKDRLKEMMGIKEELSA